MSSVRPVVHGRAFDPVMLEVCDVPEYPSVVQFRAARHR
jgi:hypothetical protein